MSEEFFLIDICGCKDKLHVVSSHLRFKEEKIGGVSEWLSAKFVRRTHFLVER